MLTLLGRCNKDKADVGTGSNRALLAQSNNSAIKASIARKWRRRAGTEDKQLPSTQTTRLFLCPMNLN